MGQARSGRNSPKRNYEAVEDGSMKLFLSNSAKMKAKDPIKTLGFEDD